MAIPQRPIQQECSVFRVSQTKSTKKTFRWHPRPHGPHLSRTGFQTSHRPSGLWPRQMESVSRPHSSVRPSRIKPIGARLGLREASHGTRTPPEEVMRDIAEFRAHEKYDPTDYARRTVTKAQAELKSSSSPQIPGPVPGERAVRIVAIKTDRPRS